MTGGIKITLADGRVLRRRMPFNRGGAENPLPVGEIEEKFLANATNTLPPDQAQALLDVCRRVEEIDNVSALARLCFVARL